MRVAVHSAAPPPKSNGMEPIRTHRCTAKNRNVKMHGHLDTLMEG